MSDDTYDPDKNYVLAVEGFEDALADLMNPLEIIVVIVDHIDGRTVYRTFDSEEKAAHFVDRMSEDQSVEKVSYAFTFLNHTDADDSLWTVH